MGRGSVMSMSIYVWMISESCYTHNIGGIVNMEGFAGWGLGEKRGVSRKSSGKGLTLLGYPYLKPAVSHLHEARKICGWWEVRCG